MGDTRLVQVYLFKRLLNTCKLDAIELITNKGNKI